MINFWKLAYGTVKEKRDQHKAENEQLKEENEKLKTQKIAFQRSYKQAYEENEKLEQIRDIKDSALKGADIKIKTLERENEKLRKANSSGWKQKDDVINKLIINIKSKHNLLSEISQHIGNKPSSSTYKYFREKLDGIGIKEDE